MIETYIHDDSSFKDKDSKPIYVLYIKVHDYGQEPLCHAHQERYFVTLFKDPNLIRSMTYKEYSYFFGNTLIATPSDCGFSLRGMFVEHIKRLVFGLNARGYYLKGKSCKQLHS